MRFLADGPQIPDDLLVARDQGRVMFFCGAGISLARAELPGFFGLAQIVVDFLGVEDDSPVRKLIDEAREFESRTGLSGIVSADRVFGLLERDFSVRDIQSAVAKALKPGENVDLSAHGIMLDLAKGHNGKVRLITTNFDLLFESCDSSLPCSGPPRLPDLLRREEPEGIIHLHGHVDKDYSRADGDGFVLSSSEFGRAYLSDGWATEFIKTILDQYYVVFIGYAADDPPIQYLLEALNREFGSLERIYAFQAGSTSDAEAKWRHKGVRPIAYEQTGKHEALWNTLTAWANRAKDPEAWYDNVITLSRRGPAALLSHQRGQVAHVVSTLEGARRFSVSDDPSPAEWLCVFDPSIRYSRPRIVYESDDESSYDPFGVYGLDGDPVPPKIDPEDFLPKREIPEDVWNCFAPTRLDHQSFEDHNFAALSGRWSVNVPTLPPRLWQLGVWISKVSHQPAAIWWASGRAGVHPAIQDQIRFELERSRKTSSPEVRRAWRYVFEAWKIQKKDYDLDWYKLKASIDLDGWTNAAIRQLALISRPHLKAERCYSFPKLSENSDDVRINDLIDLNLEYPRIDSTVQIPTEFLVFAVREFRKNLEYAVVLERELDAYGLHHLCSIEPDLGIGEGPSERTLGASGYVLFYVDLLKRLIEENPAATKQEYLAWQTDDETVFARLRIWAAGQPSLLSVAEAGRLLCRLDHNAFWDSYHQKDLHLVLAKRWNQFTASTRKRLERRLLRGRPRSKGEKKVGYAKLRALLSLNRIHWMQTHGCTFGFDVTTSTSRLHKLVPEWEEEHAAGSEASMEAYRGGLIETDKDYTPLLAEPLNSLLHKAAEFRERGRMGSFETKDPFAGLAAERPVRAFAALVNSAKRNEYPEWAWRTFLNSQAQKLGRPRLTGLIAERISGLPLDAVAQFIREASTWLLQASGTLIADYPKHFDRVWTRLFAVLRAEPERCALSIARHNKKRDWTMEAINSPAGHLAQAEMTALTKIKLELGKGFPVSEISRVEELLALEGDLRRHALVNFTFNLNWFFAMDRVWTEKNLLSVLDKEGDDQNAFWAGFFRNAFVPTQALYVRLKSHLLRLARLKSVDWSDRFHYLPGFLLAGWGTVDKETGERLITHAEMRDILLNVDENFRSQILWQLRTLPKRGKGDWEGSVSSFLSDAWPRQKKAKSPRITADLFELAFSDTTNFPKVVDTILPLVTKIDQQRLVLHDLKRLNDEIVRQFPEKTLSLLIAVLPDNVSAWPYGIEDMLEQIRHADPSLLGDGRLVDLTRRWNAR